MLMKNLRMLGSGSCIFYQRQIYVFKIMTKGVFHNGLYVV